MQFMGAYIKNYKNCIFMQFMGTYIYAPSFSLMLNDGADVYDFKRLYTLVR